MSRVRNCTFYHALGRCQTQLAVHAIYHRQSRHLNDQASAAAPALGAGGRQREKRGRETAYFMFFPDQTCYEIAIFIISWIPKPT